MFDVKILLLSLIFLLFVLIGFVFYRRAKNKLKFFESLISFSNNIRNEISFSLLPLTQIEDVYNNPTITKYLSLLKNKQEITRNLCDISMVNEFFYNLGRHSATEEEKKIENFLLYLQECKIKATEELRKASTIFKIFVIVGVLSVVLLC